MRREPGTRTTSTAPVPVHLAFVSRMEPDVERLLVQHFCPSEREEYAGLAAGRRRGWVASRLALKLAGRHAGGHAPLDQLAVGRDRCGRPTLAALPGHHCSLAHAGDAGAAAVSRQSVGIDLEPSRRFDDRFAQRIGHPDELALLAARAPAHLRPTILWTMKEAVLKATGRGLAVDPRRVRLVGGSGGDWVLWFQDTGAMATAWRLTTSQRRGFTIAVASPLPGWED